MKRDGDRIAITGERLVDGVVDDLVDHVVETGAVLGVADIHAGPPAHGLQAAQDLNLLRAVFRIAIGFNRFCCIGHDGFRFYPRF